MSKECRIESLSNLPEHRDILIQQIKSIFFETSARKNFSSDEQKEKFFFNWTNYYLQNYSDEFLVAVDFSATKPKLLGYLSGCSDSQLALKSLEDRIGSYTLFADLFEEYPAHFHINFSPEAQGLGLGTRLVNAYKSLLKEKSVSAVHIITAADSRNVSFYFRNEFTDMREREFMGSRLKFMGCRF